MKKLYIVNNTPLTEKIEGVSFLNREGDYIKKLLNKASIGTNNVSFSHLRENLKTDLQSAQSGVIVSLGAIVTSDLLGLRKSLKMEEYIGLHFPFYGKTVIPWYSASHLLIRGKKLEQLTMNLFIEIKGMIL